MPRACDQAAQAGSSRRVTGPSLTSSTSIRAPNDAPLRAEALAEALVQRLGDLGRRGVDVARAVALAGVGVEGELAHAEHLALAERLVHAPVGVLEHAQRPDLVGEPVRLGLAVVRADAEQHQQAGTDRGDLLAVDAAPPPG